MEMQEKILEHIPVDHILPFRQVCKAYKDHIDKRVYSNIFTEPVYML